MSITTEQAAVWFEKRAKNTPMPGAREMFKIAAATLREKVERDARPQTNADRIRAMSDEELARWISDMWHGFVSKPWCDFRCQNCREGDDYRCEKCALEWNKQPAEVKDDG